MQANIHPNYTSLAIHCNCGNSIDTFSSCSMDSLSVELCASCHPAFTGQKKTGPATGDRISRFNKRFKRNTSE